MLFEIQILYKRLYIVKSVPQADLIQVDHF